MQTFKSRKLVANSVVIGGILFAGTKNAFMLVVVLLKNRFLVNVLLFKYLSVSVAGKTVASCDWLHYVCFSITRPVSSASMAKGRQARHWLNECCYIRAKTRRCTAGMVLIHTRITLFGCWVIVLRLEFTCQVRREAMRRYQATHSPMCTFKALLSKWGGHATVVKKIPQSKHKQNGSPGCK